jgi:hypothetical protein
MSTKQQRGWRMDPVTLAAILTAVVAGASEALGGQLLTGLVALVKRPWRRKAADADSSALPRGEVELMALQEAPDDQQKALALAETLLARSQADGEFGQALEQWYARTEPVRASIGDVTNTISGGTQLGPVLQGRDFTNLTFAATPPPAAR